MQQAFICDAIRTPIGRYGGALSSVRADDLGAIPIRALMARNPHVDWEAVTDVIYGCANQAGEDNRNVAHMSSLLAGSPVTVPGATVNRLCGSGLDAIGTAARAIKAGEATLLIAGGVESMSRAPFVMPKAETAFSRAPAVYDTTIGWRFVNALMKAQYGIDSMPETAENVATEYNRVLVMDAIINPDPANVKKRADEQIENSAKIDAAWKVYLTTELAPEEKALIPELEAAQSVYRKEGLGAAREASLAGQGEEAARIYREKVSKLAPRFTDVLDKLLDLQVSQAKTVFDTASKTNSSVKASSIGVTVAALALGALLALGITRSIAQPISEALHLPTVQRR